MEGRFKLLDVGSWTVSDIVTSKCVCVWVWQLMRTSTSVCVFNFFGSSIYLFIYSFIYLIIRYVSVV